MNIPAFPLPLGEQNIDPSVAGMTLRDYFAAKAMQGFCTAFSDWSHTEITNAAYKQADSMLEARK